MEFSPGIKSLDVSVQEGRRTVFLDPYRYLRQADLALHFGTRDEAVALIAQAYLAFDLVCNARD
jgi:hypothetical protein